MSSNLVHGGTDGEEYSQISILNDWHAVKNNKSKWQNICSWGLIIIPSNGVMFVHAGNDLSAPTRTIHVKDDMSIELRVAGRLASFPVYGKLKCFNDIYEVLQQVPCLNICSGSDGTGNCPCVYYIKKPHSSSGRCKTCQLKHKKDHDRCKQREKRLEENLRADSKKKKKMKETIKRRHKKAFSNRKNLQTLRLMSAVITSSTHVQNKSEDSEKLFKQLLECIQECQRRFGGKTELATEYDSCIVGLCLLLEAVFLHGLRVKPCINQTQSSASALKQVSDIVAQSLSINNEKPSFWPFVKRHLTNHEQERYAVLKQIWTDTGRGKAWIRSALNERSLERYCHSFFSDTAILREYYESWAILRDDEKSSMLPNMAAGLGSILFAISIDKPELNNGAAPRPDLLNSKIEPIIEVPVPERQKERKRRKVARQFISFDDDDSIMSTSIPSCSSSNSSDSNSISSIENTSHKNKSKHSLNEIKEEIKQSTMHKKETESKKSPPKTTGRTLSVESSGSREKYSTKVPETLTPLSESEIGVLTPVSVEVNKNFKSPDSSDEILEVELEDPSDISAILTAVQVTLTETSTPLSESEIGVLTPVSVEANKNFESLDSSDEMLEVPSDISAILTAVESKNNEELCKKDEKILLLLKENEALKEQVKKYVSAIQMLRRDDDNMQKALEGLQIEQQPDYRGEAKVFEKKLVQVAEMHAELMDFNVMLQQSLCKKDALLERLKNELEELRGPMPSDALNSEETRGSVNVWIPSAFLTGSGSSSHHVYQIFLRAGNDEWNIYRRYAQFHAFHTDLKKLDPVLSTFDFPPKKSLGKKDSGLVEDRRKRLQIYLRKVLAHWPELAHCSSRFLLEQHLSFFKDQREDLKNKKSMFSSRRTGNSSNNYSGL